MSINDFDEVQFNWVWAGESRSDILRVSVLESNKEANVNQLVVRELSKFFRSIGKVVIYNGSQVVNGWSAQSFLHSSRQDLTVQAWGQPFNVQIYDAL